VAGVGAWRGGGCRRWGGRLGWGAGWIDGCREKTLGGAWGVMRRGGCWWCGWGGPGVLGEGVDSEWEGLKVGRLG